MLPQVSVVIPSRDAAQWLPTSLGSLTHQTGVELELLVVDDGSRDHSCEIVQQFRQRSPWPLRLLQAGGGGVSAARNLGWRAARHPLVAFLDADDLALPGRLQRQAELLLQDANLQQVLSGWQRVGPDGQVLTDVRPWLEGAGFGLHEALRHKAVLPSAWMLRRSALEAVGGFDASLSQAEDVDLLLRLARIGAAGTWLPEVLCCYRVHAEGASQRARPQVHGLSVVVERHLASLSSDPADRQLAAEVRYGTRAWLGWYAWHCGDHPLALELWTQALGLSPFPPGLTWVHLAENVVRSARRVGASPELNTLLASPHWAELEARWWRARQQPLLGMPLAIAPELDWQPIHRGQVHKALLAWREQFVAELEADERAPGPSRWTPTIVAEWLASDSSVAVLQRAVLRWCSDLIALPLQQAAQQGLHQRLAEILLQWAWICWLEDRRPTQRRLEQAIAVLPTHRALEALARLQRSSSAAGCQALKHLVAAGAPRRDDPSPWEAAVVSGPPAEPAFWERDDMEPDRCAGPQCQHCIQVLRADWRASPAAHGVIVWQATGTSAVASERELAVLQGGQGWLRPPQGNAWGSSHAFSIADRSGEPLPAFSRRYPQPWPGVCPCPQPAPQPPPPGDPHQVNATVVALLGLSAETYYHWLLEVLPSLGWLVTHHPQMLGPDVKLWHNGGTAPYVRDTLQSLFGIRSDQLLDARALPWIQAEQLLAVSPAPFANPSLESQAWLRARVLPGQLMPVGSASPKAVWLQRGRAGRRPVFGECEVLEMLRPDGVVPIDCARLPVGEQARLVAGASVVIAPHGGAMANLVFATAGSTVLELHHRDYHPPYFQSLARDRGLVYQSQVQSGRPPALYRDLLFESPATQPILLDTTAVVQAVRSLL